MADPESEPTRPPQSHPRQYRLGPRPLPQHLSLAAATWANSAAALPALSSALANSHSNPSQSPEPNLKQLQASLAELGPQIQAADPAALMTALQLEGRRRFGQLLTGIEAYRKHPNRRDLAPAPVLWDQGTTKLRDYRTQAESGKSTKRPRVLVIPSLVNRYYVLDLDRETSFLRWLDAHGCDPFVVDWDGPGYLERGFSLTDYVAGRLEAALDAVKREPGGPIYLVGYCMGGNLALALALRRQAEIAGLICLATPWDFHAENLQHAQMLGQIGRQLEPVLQTLGELPVDMLQAFFSGLDPFQVLKKFQYFGTLDQSGDSARRFVALEDWLNDGISLAAPVTRECMIGWYGENSPQALQWKIADAVVDPAQLDRPVLNVIPTADRIVPPESSRALTRRFRRVEEMVPTAGHIGMMVGRTAARDVWEKLAEWMRAGT
nr:alpha/beta fold hydrolase [uncultured Dongia sp.]